MDRRRLPWSSVPIRARPEGRKRESDTPVGQEHYRGSSEPLDAGVAFGGGVQYRVASNLTLATESSYHWGILLQNVDGTTRLVAVQFGVTVHSR